MSKIKFCPSCESNSQIKLVEYQDTVTIKGRQVTYSAKSFQCDKCNEIFDTKQTLGNNLAAAKDAYEQENWLPVEELKSLRTSYGASQKAFGQILGFGELTINSYEQGAIPNSPNRLLLQLAADPHIFKEMFRLNSHRIGALQRKRIEKSANFVSGEYEYTPVKSSPEVDNVISIDAAREKYGYNASYVSSSKETESKERIPV